MAKSKTQKEMTKSKTQSNSSGEGLSEDASKILAALSYPIWLVALVTVLIAKPKDKYAKYHAYQGLFWGIAMIIVYIALSIVFSILAFIPYLGVVTSVLMSLLGLAILGVEIYFAVLAYQGKTFKIPVINGLIPASAKY